MHSYFCVTLQFMTKLRGKQPNSTCGSSSCSLSSCGTDSAASAPGQYSHISFPGRAALRQVFWLTSIYTHHQLSALATRELFHLCIFLLLVLFKCSDVCCSFRVCSCCTWLSQISCPTSLCTSRLGLLDCSTTPMWAG